MKSVHSCREETLWQTFCPTSRSRCIFKNSDSRERKVFFRDRMRSLEIACDRLQSLAITCDRLQLHAIAWQSGVGSRTTRRIEFDLLPLPPPTNASSRPSRCLPLYRQNSIATSRRIINYIAILSVIASSYRPFHVVTRRHTSSHHTVTSLYHCCCHAT